MAQVYEDYGEPVDPTGRRKAYGWMMEALQNRLPTLTPILGSVIRVLAGRGLIEDTAIGSFDYMPRWVVTDLGRDCLAELERRGREDSG